MRTIYRFCNFCGAEPTLDSVIRGSRKGAFVCWRCGRAVGSPGEHGITLTYVLCRDQRFRQEGIDPVSVKTDPNPEARKRRMELATEVWAPMWEEEERKVFGPIKND